MGDPVVTAVFPLPPTHLPIGVSSVRAYQPRLREYLLHHRAERDMARGLCLSGLVTGAWTHIIDLVPKLKRINLLVAHVHVAQHRGGVRRSCRGRPLVLLAHATGFVKPIRHPKHEVACRRDGEAVQVSPVRFI